MPDYFIGMMQKLLSSCFPRILAAVFDGLVSIVADVESGSSTDSGSGVRKEAHAAIKTTLFALADLCQVVPASESTGTRSKKNTAP